MSKRWWKKISNKKYLIATMGFLCFIFFFDENDVFRSYKYSQELKSLQAESEYYQSEIIKDSIEISRMKNDLKAIEHYGREVYKMKRKNEDIFVIKNTQTP